MKNDRGNLNSGKNTWRQCECQKCVTCYGHGMDGFHMGAHGAYNAHGTKT
jgi:hypothetical protein